MYNYRPKTNPWGNFKGTWQLPEKITRSIATELSGPQVGSSRWALPGTTRKSAKGKHRHSHRQESGDCCEVVPEDLTDSNEVQPNIKKVLFFGFYENLIFNYFNYLE